MATELAKAYVQILPSAQGMKNNLTNLLNSEMPDASPSGEKVGQSLVSGIKKVIAAAGIGKLLKDTFAEGAALEQSVGGVETLFKDSADAVIENANNAYQTAGLSANQYMEIVTGFSAKLLQGLGGDTKKAAKVADQALVAMSDNANKFGTDMQSIINAYQGFSKENYTMLDNLKLGYGGTASEMANLINDSGVLGNSIEVTAETVKDVPFDKIIEAIGVIQDNLGITGTTAKEAATTFSGSMASMKASAKNLLGALASGKDVEKATDTFVKTAETFLGNNFVPMLGRILNSAGSFIRTTIQNAPEFLSSLVKELDFESASTLFATLTAPKFASKLLDTFRTNSSVKTDLKSAGDSIGTTIGDNTVGKAAETGTGFANKFSQGLSAASSVVSAAIIGWDIGTLIYNMAKPAIDKVTDALVNAFNTDEDVELDNKLMEANAKWQVAELVQKGATWLTSADAGNQYVLDQAAKIINQAARWKDYGITPEDFRAAADLTSWNEAVAWFDSKTGMTGVNKITTGARNWGDDLTKNMAQGMLDGSAAVTAAAAVVAGGIKSVLGFSEPEEGPLSDFHTYAPDMMQLFAQGIADNKSLVEDEVIGLMSSVRGAMTEPVEADSSLTAGNGESQKIIIMRLVDNYGKTIAEATVDDIDELQGASVLLSERGLAR